MSGNGAQAETIETRIPSRLGTLLGEFFEVGSGTIPLYIALFAGSQDQVAIGFFVGAVVMAIGGIAELLFGVRAEQRQLEYIAEPLTAERGGARRQPRLRVGPGPLSSARAMSVAGPHPEVSLDREIEIIGRALEDRGAANRRELARRVGARYWGPGRFRSALRKAVAEGAVTHLRGGEYAPAHSAAERSSSGPAEH